MKPLGLILFCIASLGLGLDFSTASSLVKQPLLLESASASASGPISQDKLTERIDSNGRYNLTWEIKDNVITFEVDADTPGWVGLGISPTGKMTGADIFIAGVHADGSYSGDYHATANAAPTLDAHSDWTLHEAREVGNHTYLKVSRLLNTCDAQDYPITEENTARVIWALGATDTIAYHNSTRGVKSVNLVAIPEPDVDMTKLIEWNVLVNTTVPAEDTTYWCTIHKGPILTEKHHVVGFDVYLENANATAHTHHMIVTKCTPPAGSNASALFEEFVGDAGENCYEGVRLPSDHCRKYLFVWAVGGKRTMFPLEAGYPIDGSEQDLYYMLEVHYDNPKKLENVQFTTGVHIYHTKELRRYDAALLTVGHDTTLTLLIPPNQTDFVISGHCSSACSSRWPAAGLHVFNVLLHSHLSGRKLKLRHFRNGAELPWLAFDDTYDFDFQQNKPLLEPVIIMPNDALTYECTYDSSWNDGKVVFGGLSSREEMCLTFMWVYATSGTPNIDICGSEYPVEGVLADFRIQVADFGNGPVIALPAEYAGIPLTDYLNQNFTWTDEFIRSQQDKHRYGQHHTMCCARGEDCGLLGVNVTYPSYAAPYEQEDRCSSNARQLASSVTFIELALFLGLLETTRFLLSSK